MGKGREQVLMRTKREGKKKAGRSDFLIHRSNHTVTGPMLSSLPQQMTTQGHTRTSSLGYNF